ncbi:hypothetical protein BDQ94DRAFT_144674 [Aspergillus welwitschiae]|uniref:Uncharacterized protein n=1 Tax=Aspergillus welwitschiae TaxID=1341132 RepID=A0A3F3Q0P9_9EURO|nr:hypothetical protein BDQ94DRAFT_144674 [Aspergillus welwitschiae]RDH32597.1 hypothetical protein BDQ94DRAFT_144674 [Aspergillus welwitschiae]
MLNYLLPFLDLPAEAAFLSAVGTGVFFLVWVYPGTLGTRCVLFYPLRFDSQVP